MSLATADDLNVIPGLEDVSDSDVYLPRIKVDGPKAVFVDTLTNEEFPEMTGIILGLVKQRTLWPAVISDTPESPLCRSTDYLTGHPGDKFPWPNSGFDQATYVAGGAGTLPCESCALKEWGAHPVHENRPWCGDKYVFAIMRSTGDGGMAPALVEFHGSGIKPCKAYVSSFKSAGVPMFTAVTSVTLTPDQRGGVKYATPKFTKGRAVPEEMHAELATQLRSTRAFLQTPPRARENDDDGGAGVPATVPAPQPSPPTPVREPVPVGVAVPTTTPVAAAIVVPDDDLPF